MTNPGNPEAPQRQAPTCAPTSVGLSLTLATDATGRRTIATHSRAWADAWVRRVTELRSRVVPMMMRAVSSRPRQAHRHAVARYADTGTSSDASASPAAPDEVERQSGPLATSRRGPLPTNLFGAPPHALSFTGAYIYE